MSFVAHNPHYPRTNNAPYAHHQFAPQNRKPANGYPVNLSVGGPQPRNLPMNPQNKVPQYSPSKNMPEQYPRETQQQDRVKDLNSDLVRLKKQLNDIMVDAQSKKHSLYEGRKNDRSLDNINFNQQTAFNQSYPSPSLGSSRFEKFNTTNIPRPENFSPYSGKKDTIMEDKRPKAFSLSGQMSTEKVNQIQIEDTIREQAKNQHINICTYPIEVYHEKPTEEKVCVYKVDQVERHSTEEKFDKKQMEKEYEHKINLLNFEIKMLKKENEQLKKDIKGKDENIDKLATRNNQLLQQIQNIEKRESFMKKKLSKLESSNVNLKNAKNTNFDTALKEQLEEIATYKQIIQKKNDQISGLNEYILMNKRQAESKINDSNIEKVKYLSLIKQQRQKHDISLLNKENQIKTIKNTLVNLEGKLQVAVQDNKMKDQFIQSHLMGRMKLGEEQEYVKDILSKYQITFPVNSLLEKLQEQERQIEELKQMLKK